MPRVKVGDINIYYEVHGKGEPLVMIAGITLNTSFWFKAIPVFSREYRLIVFDNRGAGQSDQPDIPYTTEMMADDLAGLLDVIGIASTHILGHSMGGMIAQQFVLRHPKRVRSLILECTYCGGPGSSMMTGPEAMRFVQRMPSLSGKELMMDFLRLFMTQKFFDDNPGMMQQMLGQLMKHPATPQGSGRQGQAIMGHNAYDRLPEIKSPTLVIAGDVDKMIPVENSRIIASRIPNAELVILKNAGHILIEAAEESNRIILDFLRRHSTKKS